MFTEVDYIPLQTKLKSTEDVAINHIEANKENSENKTNYFEHKSLLVNEFGTNKSRKVVESMKSNIVKEENISSKKAMKEIIDKNVKEDEIKAELNKKEAGDKNIESMRAILPPFNTETKEATEIFDLNEGKTNILNYK